MKFYLGVTDTEWYNHLRMVNPEDINFWQPGGSSSFKVLAADAYTRRCAVTGEINSN